MDSSQWMMIAAVTLCLGAQELPHPPGPPPAADPQRELPRETWEIPSDPYVSGIAIGPMYRPHGKIRRVSWYQDGYVGAQDDPEGWEKQVAQRFDESGRCVETEAWSLGFQQARRWVDIGSPTRPPQSTSWDFPQGSCTRTRCVRDDLGRVRLLIREDSKDLDPIWERARQQVATEYEYDPSGRVREAVEYGRDGSPARLHRWSYDRHGRVREHRSHACLSGSGLVEGFLYLPNGLVRAHLVTIEGEPATHRTEYRYDSDGRVLSRSETLDGAELWTMSCTYDFDGTLAIRETSDRRLNATRRPPRSILIEEIFAGIDRPLHHVLRDSRGDILEWIGWTYQDDERGNWVVRRCLGKVADQDDVMRVIEYAD